MFLSGSSCWTGGPAAALPLMSSGALVGGTPVDVWGASACSSCCTLLVTPVVSPGTSSTSMVALCSAGTH
eukprot:9530821-Ditylum_brightwellii.AAC.1